MLPLEFAMLVSCLVRSATGVVCIFYHVVKVAVNRRHCLNETGKIIVGIARYAALC